VVIRCVCATDGSTNEFVPNGRGRPGCTATAARRRRRTCRRTPRMSPRTGARARKGFGQDRIRDADPPAPGSSSRLEAAIGRGLGALLLERPRLTVGG